MKHATIKHQPRPAQQAAERMRRTIGEQRAAKALAAACDGLSDPEACIEVFRSLIRGANRMAASMGGAARAVGILAGAAAEVAPAYRSEKKFTEAEALFAQPSQGDE